ncbi:MAG: dipeptidase [Chlorobi bacterium]|nr:dipeptidase [Chlorobiota bacterium]
MKKKSLLSFILFILILFVSNGYACTNFLITKGASTDGSTMISYNADSHVLFGELYFWPAADYPDGTMVDVYEWDTGKFLGKIKQVNHTYTVVGNMNEYQVAIGETTYGGRSELHHQPEATVDYGSLMYLALQRAKTAREAIKVMTDLVAEYGYYSEGESFSISDPNEVWIMEMIGKGEKEKGAVWVARQIPDGYVSGHANQARITTFPFSKKNDWFNQKQTTFHSKDVISFARKKGYFKGKDADFSFSDTYAPVDFGGARFCEIRVWSMFKDVNSNMQQYFDYVKGNITHDEKTGYANNRMPLWIKPDRKISVHDMMNFMRDHLEGTELDMSKDWGAGPFHVPYRWRPLTWEVDSVEYCNERTTATQQTGFTFVAQARSWMPPQIGGIFWFGVDDPANNVYTPMYCGIERVPHAFERGNGSMMDFTMDAAFWVFNMVSNFAYTKYSYIHPEIAKVQQNLENEYIEQTKQIDAQAKDLYSKNKEEAIELVTDYSVKAGEQSFNEWKKLYGYLFTKYMDGNVKEPIKGQQNPKLEQPGYSPEWYKELVKQTGNQFKVIGNMGH